MYFKSSHREGKWDRHLYYTGTGQAHTQGQGIAAEDSIHEEKLGGGITPQLA